MRRYRDERGGVAVPIVSDLWVGRGFSDNDRRLVARRLNGECSLDARASRSARQSPASAVGIAGAVLGRVVGDPAMVGEIGAACRGRAAIAEFGTRRVA